jgi:hypothetical protein
MPYEPFSARQMQRLVGGVVNELPIDDSRPLYHAQYNPRRVPHNNASNHQQQYEPESELESEPEQRRHHNHNRDHQQHHTELHTHEPEADYDSFSNPHPPQPQDDTEIGELQLRPSFPSRRISSRPPVELYSHPARCPPLNLEFLWKIYHQRNNVNQLVATREERIATLNSQGFPSGLAALMLEHSIHHPIRIWLIDNCGTMHKSDGHMVSQSKKGKVHVVPCTRWEEITSTVLWHAEMAAWQQTPMAVRLLQDPGAQVGPQQLGVSASKHYCSSDEVTRMKTLLKKTRPVGATSPISLHLQELFPCIQAMVSIFMRMEKKLTLCICTDSIPTDADGNEDPKMIQEFLTTLQQLVDWPVQVVMRLSTDEERVVQFYRNLQVSHEAFREKVMVLDDYISECQHVQENNPWLNYGYPLHLCREEGIRVPLLDALSERPLHQSELCEMVLLIFGERICCAQTDYPKFRKTLQLFNKETGVLWNPIKKKFVPWVDLKRLDRRINKAEKNGEKCIIS